MLVRLGLLFNHRLDANFADASISKFENVHVRISDIRPEPVRSECLAGGLDAVVLECPHKNACPFEFGEELIANGLVRGVVLLDREFCVVRAHRALQTAGIGYLSRNCSVYHLVHSINRLMLGEIVLDAAAELSNPTSRVAAQRNLMRFDRHGLLSLSPRERQVMQLLAEGLTVVDAARVLGLTVSTIDNHRSRLKKKLNIRRSIEIAHVALREGIISNIRKSE